MLVNSAGILINGDTASLGIDDYDRCMNINTKAAFILTQKSIPHLLKTKGNIVHVSSVTGLRAFPNVVAYNMSKAAVDQLTRTAALELASQGVRVNAVNPGVIVTEIHRRAGMNDERYVKKSEGRAVFARYFPIPSDIAPSWSTARPRTRWGASAT